MQNRQTGSKVRGLLACFVTACLVAASVALLKEASPVRQTSAISGPRLQTADAASRQRMLAAYRGLPLAFETNQGQSDARVKYLARGNGYTLFLTANEAVLALGNEKRGGDTSLPPDVIRMQVDGTEPWLEPVGEEQLDGCSNYFIGQFMKKWLTNVPRYARVSYAEVYPGVSLAYHGGQGQLEFDFMVSAGADPSQIALQFSGARDMRTDEDGNLVLASAGRKVVVHRPVAYQEREGKRQRVDARFVIKHDKVSFALGEYDGQSELVIDPTVTYATFLGGSGEDLGRGIAVDGSGNAYITGEAGDSTFPNTVGPVFGIGSPDVFVTKLSPVGTLLYSTFIGGNAVDVGV